MATPICANTGCSNTAHPKDIKSICYGECGCGGICKNKFYWNNCDKCYKEENGEEDDDDCDEECAVCDDCEGKCKKEISEIFNYYENKYIRKELPMEQTDKIFVMSCKTTPLN
jgi:hypothetical protein